MSINKSQGQSVNYVGLDLWNAVFTHGQLYVGVLLHLPIVQIALTINRRIKCQSQGLLDTKECRPTLYCLKVE